LPQNIQERRQKELQELQEKGIQFQQESRQELQNAYAEMMEPIYKKLDDAIKAIGKAGGYTYVFDLDRTDIPYIDETQSKDVTNDIKTNLGISLTAVPAAAPAASTTAAETTALQLNNEISFIKTIQAQITLFVLKCNLCLFQLHHIHVFSSRTYRSFRFRLWRFDHP
jgi:hypothetical protein